MQSGERVESLGKGVGLVFIFLEKMIWVLEQVGVGGF